MSSAFTHLFNKINISLFDNTLTLYPKSISPRANNKQIDIIADILFPRNDRNNKQVRLFLDDNRWRLENPRFIRRRNKNHNKYHQDNFNGENIHYHIQFKKTIDKEKFEEILLLLEVDSIITKSERTICMQDFDKSNKIVLKNSSSASNNEASSSQSGSVAKIIRSERWIYFGRSYAANP